MLENLKTEIRTGVLAIKGGDVENNYHKKPRCENTLSTITVHGSYLGNCLP